MKTAERNSRIRWADMFSVCANGTAGRNRRCSSTWGWKQEKLKRWERYFLLTSPSIEHLYKRPQNVQFKQHTQTLSSSDVTYKNPGEGVFSHFDTHPRVLRWRPR